MAWSAANEPVGSGPGDERYLREAKRVVRRLDPSRLFAVDASISPPEDLPAYYSELDALGLSNYIGWYGSRPLSDVRPALEEVHAGFPGVALFQTEFGAEANRHGPPAEKGSYAFQEAFLDAHLRPRRPAVDERAIVWLLHEWPDPLRSVRAV